MYDPILSSFLRPDTSTGTQQLANDALNLHQRPRIISVVFLEKTKLAVGTAIGTLRLFDTALQRKQLKEIKVFSPKVAAVKQLCRSQNANEMIASDTTGRVYVINWRTGATQYKYESE